MLEIFKILIVLILTQSLQAFTHNPNNTATIFVHGYDPSGYKKSGVFGEDVIEEFFDEVPTFLGLPTISNQEDINKPNVVTSTSYYGDIYPSYYTQQDKLDIDASEKGIPRYSLILAKYAKHLMQRTGAKQVNFISGSMGALVTRYMIEKNLENLASDKKIARWMTIEGVLNGNFAASKSKLYKLINHFDKFSIDTTHMKYKWIERNLSSPRSIAQSPYYKDILIGHETSTKDDTLKHALTLLMLSRGQFQPNDGYQAAKDTYFSNVLEPYRFYGQNPTHSYLHETHLGVKENRSLWMQIGNFILSNKRAKITILDVKVDDISEKNKWYMKRLPAEIVFETEVYSPEIFAKWGVESAMSERQYHGALPEIVKYNKKGQTKSVNQIIYNDFVLPAENTLNIKLTLREIDGDVRYDVFESFKDKDYDFIGTTNFNVPLQDGVYTFSHPDFNGQVRVEMVEYPFALLGEDAEIIEGGVDKNITLNRGDLVHYERVLSKDSNFMEQSLKQLLEKNPQITVKDIKGIDAYRVIYTTVYEGNLTNASGLVTIPQDMDTPLSIISDQHGTIFKRVNAPSVHDALTTTGTLISALKGYAVSMPDYIGYGDTSDITHPYLIKNSLATATIDLIIATKQLLNERNITTDNKLFLMGYSEGGFATLATSEYIQTNTPELNITASAPMAGSYDLKTTADIILSQENYQEAHLPVFLIYSYDKYYNLNSLDSTFNEPYANDIKRYFDGNITDINLSSQRDVLFKDEFIQTYFSNQETELKNALTKNSLIDWTPQMPMKLYHCEADKVVPVENSLIAYDSFIENGSQNIELITQEGGSHNACSLPFYIDALEWFDSYR